MKTLTIPKTLNTAVVVAGLSAAAVGLSAPALAAPMMGGDAAETVTMLEAQGNRVIVNRLSDAPLADADVVSIHRGAAIEDTVRDYRYDRTFQWAGTGHVYYVAVR